MKHRAPTLFRRGPKPSPTSISLTDPTVAPDPATDQELKRADDALRAIRLGAFMGWDDDRIVQYAKDNLRPWRDRVISLP